MVSSVSIKEKQVQRLRQELKCLLRGCDSDVLVFKFKLTYLLERQSERNWSSIH